MFPYFYLFGKLISVYALLSLIGVLAAGAFAYRTAKKTGRDPVSMTILLLVAVSAGWAGSHLTYALVGYKDLIKVFSNLDKIPSFSVFLEYMQYLFGGAVYYGGLIFGILAGLLYAKRKKLDRSVYADMGAPAIPLFHAFGRIGCFLGGCCYGVECKIGFIYTRAAIEEANGVRRFPFQLAEAFFNFALFAFLWYLLAKGRLKGKLLPLYLCLYGVIRFILEFWRGDEHRGFILGLSTSQLISLILFACGLFMLIRPSKEAEDSP